MKKLILALVLTLVVTATLAPAVWAEGTITVAETRGNMRIVQWTTASLAQNAADTTDIDIYFPNLEDDTLKVVAIFASGAGAAADTASLAVETSILGTHSDHTGAIPAADEAWMANVATTGFSDLRSDRGHHLKILGPLFRARFISTNLSATAAALTWTIIYEQVPRVTYGGKAPGYQEL